MYERSLNKATEAAAAALDTAEKELPVKDPILESLGIDPVELLPREEQEAEAQKANSHYSTGQTTSVEERALSLLGSGISAESVAGALGVTPARISQLLAEESFAKRVADLRYKSLQSHNKRDGQYDSLEDKLIKKLEESLPLMVKPVTILKAIATINGAKRRGQSAPEQVVNQQNIVNLILPQVIADKFSVNGDNQVTKAGEQELLTMASGNLLQQVEDAADKQAATIEHKPDKEE